MSFHVIRNDITKVKADAIVNTANPKPIYGNGVDHAIYKAAGEEELLAARREIGDIKCGDAVETPAFGLDAKYIIHTVGPIWQGGNAKEIALLKSCYRKSLKLAIELGCTSVAFPLIAAGSYGFPKDKALQTAMSVIEAFTMEYDIEVTLVVFNTDVLQLTGKVYEKIDAYIDNYYVKKAKEEEYANQNRYARYEKELLQRKRCEAEYQNGFRSSDEESLVNNSICIDSNPIPIESDSYVDIESLLKTREQTFQEKLFEIIDERGLTGPQVYNNYISKQVYSKIQSDKYYHPNKYTAIALCLSLHLNYRDTIDLIGRAGWTLSPSVKQDLVVKACIINRLFNVAKIDIKLLEYGCPELSKIK